MLLADVEAEFDDVAGLHDVGFAFGAKSAGLFGGGFGAGCYQIVIIKYAGGNEATFEVAVDNASGLGSGVATPDGPGADFLFAGGQVTLEAERGIGGMDQLEETGFSLPITLQ